jgi:hypothetical protein
VAYYAAPRAPVSWPHQLGLIPRQADCFQHRAAVDALAAAVAGDTAAVPCRVLSGAGGVGKTQLAARYARAQRQAGSVDLLLWITAASREAVLAGYAQAGVDVAQAGPGNPEQAAARLLTWLETTDRRWLVVLDDVADPADLRELWPPPNIHGRVLVTTRRRDAALTGQGRRLVSVGLFSPAEAASYLTAKLASHGRLDDPGQIAALASELGYLPLAVAQAAAYLIDLDLDCAGYRDRLADRRRTLPELLPDVGGLPDDHHATVAATWSLSIERADRMRPAGLARPMLELASMLDPNGIPTAVLTSEPALAYLAWRRTRGGGLAGAHEPPVAVDAAADALRCLHRLSLVDHVPGDPHRAIRVHNLIQRASREILSPDHREVLARAAADALAAAWPRIERDTGLAQALRASADNLAALAQATLWQPRGHPVLLLAGRSLGQAGLVTAAVRYWQQQHAAARHHLGADHPDTLTTRHELAYWQGETGDAAGAATAFELLLADRLRMLGPDHPDTLTTRHELAWCRGAAGDATRAAAEYEQLLADRLRILGADHRTP